MISRSASNRIFSADFVWSPEADLFLYIQGNTSFVPARLQRNSLLAAAFEPGFSTPPLVPSDADFGGPSFVVCSDARSSEVE